MTAITLNLDSIVNLTNEQFYQLCQTNRDVRFERTAKGELVIMPPTGGETGKKVVTFLENCGCGIGNRS
nr:Uma2 family endonuclease [Chroococcidiopsis sp. CCMEE 29]